MTTTLEAMDQDKLRRAYARLSSIRKNLPENRMEIEEPIVQEYTDTLSILEGLGFDLEEFKIPEDWLHYTCVMSSAVRKVYTETRMVKRSYFVTKLDAVIGYFTVSEERAMIGFRNAG